MFILLINAYLIMVIYTSLADSCVSVFTLSNSVEDWIDT